MEHTATAYAEPGLALGSRVRLALRSETAIARTGLALVALHIVDDNFLQPAAGTAAADHLLSGLVPIAILALAAAFLPRLRPGARAATAITFGALALTIGGPGAYYLSSGEASGDHYTGLVALGAGALLLLTGTTALWKTRRRYDRTSRRYDRTSRRYIRRTLRTLLQAALAVLITWFVVFPVGFAYIYTHTGRTPTTPDLGVPLEEVAVTTSDSLKLKAWYAPSRNRAAVVLFPGTTRTEEARMLLRHGYGVLLLEPRGQGGSQGDIVRWAGDQDLLAAAAYLQNRADIDPDRIGAIGFSIGGENLLEAAAQSTAFKAVISEGAGVRVGEADVLTGPDRLLGTPMLAVVTAATTILSNHKPPPAIKQRIGQIAPTPILLIYADPGMGGENTRQPQYYAAANHPKQIWKVPGAKHTGGINAQPTHYEQRVIDFLNNTLLNTR